MGIATEKFPLPKVDRPAALRDPHTGIPASGSVRASPMSVVAGNAVAVLKGSLRAVHGDEMVRRCRITP